MSWGPRSSLGALSCGLRPVGSRASPRPLLAKPRPAGGSDPLPHPLLCDLMALPICMGPAPCLGILRSLRPAGPCPDLREWTWGLGLPGPVPSPHLGSTGLGMRQAHGSREVAVCGLGAPPQPMLASGLGSGTLLEGVGGPAAATWGKGAGTLVTLRKLRQSIEADMQHEGDEPRRWWMMQGQV